MRFLISSKRRGKSGGARIITPMKFYKSEVYLLDIYGKSEKSSLTDKELKILNDQVSLE
jgi:hypothetical protein